MKSTDIPEIFLHGGRAFFLQDQIFTKGIDGFFRYYSPFSCSCLILLNAKSAQYELVLSAGINRIAFSQIQTNQDKRNY